VAGPIVRIRLPPAGVNKLSVPLKTTFVAHADLRRNFYSRAVALELSFFEAAYTT
jgi:hypothetical protein